MKLAVDATILEIPLTGVGRSVVGLYAACAGLSGGPSIAAVHRGRLQSPLPPGVRDVCWAGWVPGRLWRRGALPWYGLAGRPDVVHFPWNGGCVNLRGGPLVVLTLHDLIPLALPKLHFSSGEQEERYRANVERQLRLADLVITDSECSKRDITSRFSTRREPVVVPLACGLAAKAEDDRVGPPESGGHFLYHGGFDVRKGLDALVRVYRRLYAEGAVDVPLVMVGSPRYFSEDFAREVRDAVASGAVIEKGYVSDEELVRWLRGARALVYPSLYEGFGLPPLEAMTVGCPVITTRASSLPEVCGDAAVYVEAGSDEDLRRGILEVQRSEDLRRSLSERGRRQAATFSWERSARTFLGALDAALCER